MDTVFGSEACLGRAEEENLTSYKFIGFFLNQQLRGAGQGRSNSCLKSEERLKPLSGFK
jgi:hypothetical protein